MPIRKIVFASPHCIIDCHNGAAITTAHALQLLRKLGFECQAFCGAQLDCPEELVLDDLLVRQQAAHEVRQVTIDEFHGQMIFTLHGELPVTIFNSTSTRGHWLDVTEMNAFVRAYSNSWIRIGRM